MLQSLGVTLLAGSLGHTTFNEVTPSLNSPFEPAELIHFLVRSLADTILYALHNLWAEKLIQLDFTCLVRMLTTAFY